MSSLYWEVYDNSRYPKSGSWYGCDDGHSWNLISSWTNAKSSFTLDFTPSVAYKYHMLSVAATNTGNANARKILLTAQELIDNYLVDSLWASESPHKYAIKF